ncbi:serine hydrolase [Silvibacterium acidisoli]|uniref:serine hydrolase n=1 Tax=Acidobacteriaceae bacterium ZG23-2 TaxID=2883246 RepID=UPI00406CA883
MRIPGLLVLLFFCTFKPADAADIGALQQQVNQIAESHRGHVTLYAENLRTHETVAIHPDEPVQTASVIKLAILYEALRQIREGKASFSDPIALSSKDQVPGSGVLLFLDTPTRITFKDALTMMIVMSDNTATNLAIDHLGIENIDKTIAALGLNNTYLYKKIFTPVPPGVTMPEDQKRFGLGKTTAREMATLMTRLATCQLGAPAKPEDRALCGAAQKMLHLQFYRGGIPRYLDTLPGATEESIANKTGSLEAVRNDVGAVSTKQGMVVISAFTYDNADHSWGAEQEGEITIAKIARVIIAAWSPEGLAPWPQ